LLATNWNNTTAVMTVLELFAAKSGSKVLNVVGYVPLALAKAAAKISLTTHHDNVCYVYGFVIYYTYFIVSSLTL